MSQLKEGTKLPKSMRHKQVLDVAEEHPDASLSELASMVPSATTDLVEHVLDEYGDPAADESETLETAAASGDTDEPSEQGETGDTDGSSETENGDSGQMDEPDTETPGESNTEMESEPDAHAEGDTEADANSETEVTPDTGTEADANSETEVTPDTGADGDEPYPSLSELTEKQRETLRAIAADPEATQTELASRLDVSAPTVSNRVNSIEGFDWSDRQAFVTALFETESPDSSESVAPQAQATTQTQRVNELETRLDRVERQLDSLGDDTPSKQTIADGSGSNEERPEVAVFEDPELVHKVIHACMDAETISEKEELQIVRALLE